MRLLYAPNHYSQQRQREKKRKIYPVLMAMEAEYHREEGNSVYWETCPYKVDKVITEPEGIPFLKLPPPDRIFTKFWQYQNNGNFKYKPGTYILSANGCWWGKCKFCVENGVKYEVRTVESVIAEISDCKHLGIREVFDDSGTFPTGGWLDEFCVELKKIGIRFSCNMRLCDLDYRKLYLSGFRMLLFGVESNNQKTLDLMNKGKKVSDIKYIIKAAEAGLEPHITCMFGHPSETDADSLNTLKIVWWLLKKGYAKTAQASFYQSEEGANESQRKYVKRIYDVAKSPEFWFNKLKDINDIDDIKYLLRSIKNGLKKGV